MTTICKTVAMSGSNQCAPVLVVGCTGGAMKLPGIDARCFRPTLLLSVCVKRSLTNVDWTTFGAWKLSLGIGLLAASVARSLRCWYCCKWVVVCHRPGVLEWFYWLLSPSPRTVPSICLSQFAKNGILCYTFACAPNFYSSSSCWGMFSRRANLALFVATPPVLFYYSGLFIKPPMTVFVTLMVFRRVCKWIVAFSLPFHRKFCNLSSILHFCPFLTNLNMTRQ